jgi:hypothetical protein
MLSLLYRLVYQEVDIVELIKKRGELGNFFSLLFPTMDNSNKCFFAVNLEMSKGSYYIMSYTAVVTVLKEETRANPVATNIILDRCYNTSISAKLWHDDDMGKSSITRYVTKGSSNNDCSTTFELMTDDNMLFQVEIPGGRCATIGVSRHILNGEEFHGKKLKHRNKPHGKLTAEQFESLTIIPSSFIEKAKRYRTGNGGGSICPHQRQRSKCKDCGGSDICPHQRQKHQCKDCGGSSICEHQRVKSRCKDCGGSDICEHQRVKSQCKDCGGSSICEHHRVRSACKDCKGRKKCKHGRVSDECNDCKIYIRYSNIAADDLIAHIRNKQTDISIKVDLLQVLGKKVLQLHKSKQLSLIVSKYTDAFFALYIEYQLLPRVVRITEPHNKKQLKLWVQDMERLATVSGYND